MLGRWLVGLTHFLLRHRLAVLIVWLVPLPLLAHGSLHVSERLKSIIVSREGAPSSEVARLLGREFPRQAQFVAEITFHDPRWTADDKPFRESRDVVHEAVRGRPCVKLLTTWPELPLRSIFVSPDGHTQLSLVEIVAAPNEFDTAERCVVELRRMIREVRAGLPLPDLELLVTGPPAVDRDVGRLVREDTLRAEVIVALAGLVLLVWVFRSAAAAFLPIVTAGLGMMTCLTVVYFVGAEVRLSVYVSTVSTMTGLALGLDWALLYVTRFREEREAGKPPDEALAVAAGTAGRAVLGSGGLVLVGFSGLLVPDVDLSRSIGLAGMLTVVCTLLSTLTLTPPLLSLLGRGIDWPRWGWFRASHAAVDRFWVRWSRLVLRRPIVPLLIGAAIVVPFAPHLASLGVQNPRHEVIPKDLEARRGLDRLLEVADEGALYPIIVVLHAGDGRSFEDKGRQREVLRIFERLRAWPEVGKVQSADLLMPLSFNVFGVRLGYGFGDGFAGRFVGRNGDYLSLNVMARTSDDPTLSALVDKLDRELPAVLAAESPGLTALVGGAPARDSETRDGLLGGLPAMIPLIGAAAFVLMALLFRSLVIPVKALLLNAVSLATVFGILVLVFQEGWGLTLFGIHGSAAAGLNFITPVLLFCVLFGVSMDYEVFLVARIREEYLARTRPGDAPAALNAAHREAIAEGLSRTGGTITNAALVAFVTFAAFLSGSLRPMQEMGFALAVAVALDATLVRMMLVPAILHLLGRHSWLWPGRRGRSHSG
ncbi:MAG: MMPL family transporter [Deltaproteobacteria bacterium]|nr:MMPL family transporter [Deltaproteobacteria bacterium]